MSITLIVSKAFGEDVNEVGEEISEQEWQDFVESQDNLRLRIEPFIAHNPKTGSTIKISAPEGATEVRIGNVWFPFLEHFNGRLHMPYSQDLENPSNPMRKAVVTVANYFAAQIKHDAGDELFRW